MRRALAICVIFFLAACASRLPSTHSTERLVHTYFTKYGDRFPKTDFHSHRITKVEVLNINEDQKGIAYAESFLTLEGEGDKLLKVRVALKKRTLRWKIINWEDLTPSPASNPPP